MKKIIKLIGIEEFISKRGTTCKIIHVETPLAKREAHTECVGLMAINYFVPENLKSKINAEDVGKEFEICTIFSGNKDNLIDIIN